MSVLKIKNSLTDQWETIPTLTAPRVVNLLEVYPIGAIYISTVNTSPAELFGGYWNPIKDTFLLAAGNTYTAGGTGGEATHTLTVNEMPSHRHGVGLTGYGSLTGNGMNWGYVQTRGEYSGYEIILDEGGGQAHNNMPPYLTVYMWQRVEPPQS